MRSKLIFTALLFAAVGFATEGAVLAQQRSTPAPQGHTQFDQHDRQVTSDWYQQHKAHPPVGLRAQDQLTPEQESRLQPGRALDPDLQRKVHPVPSDLRRQLPAPPAHHRYVAVGGHVALLDDATHVVRDLIHLHG